MRKALDESLAQPARLGLQKALRNCRLSLEKGFLLLVFVAFMVPIILVQSSATPMFFAFGMSLRGGVVN